MTLILKVIELMAARLISIHDPLPEDFTRIFCSKVIDGIAQITGWLEKL